MFEKMSYVDAPSHWQNWADNGLDHLPRLTMLAAITLVWVLTLAWPPPPPGSQPRIDPAREFTPGYPLRVALPDAEPVPLEELSELVKEHQALADLDIDIPKPAAEAAPQKISSQKQSSTFDAQFADLTLEPGEFLKLDYDINEPGKKRSQINSNDGSLTVEKPLYINGVKTGAAKIRIEEGAQILISTSAVAKALGDRATTLPSRISGVLAQGTGYIPFYELRGAGIAVEYDPVGDRVSLSMPS